ncbi:hypothetical protein HOR51_gp03 [Ralstonia phage phiAp1]|uniref:Putative membrane protein n=1 Tax=Ralstonia phage phiAp1 TaxID=2783867 RepID=A0A1L7DS47_9CAUD|nr:hypothetical protein HOR51_gp03 [Ralstonia phage phiAp1]APU03144.1 putative membrane protein [Ralstonia phage phiAp1]
MTRFVLIVSVAVAAFFYILSYGVAALGAGLAHLPQ